jgi:hypothetical protein
LWPINLSNLSRLEAISSTRHKNTPEPSVRRFGWGSGGGAESRKGQVKHHTNLIPKRRQGAALLTQFARKCEEDGRFEA